MNFFRILDKKEYELKDQLGNVRVAIGDMKLPENEATSTRGVPPFVTDEKAINDYYPYGMTIADRSWQSTGYRYGYNMQEKSTEIDANGNHNTAEFWEYDTRTARRWNLDPKPTIGISRYSTFDNNPIFKNDINGDDPLTAGIEGASSFLIEVGLSFLENLIIRGESPNDAIKHINYYNAGYEGLKSTLFSVFSPTGTQTAVKLYKMTNTKMGKLVIKFTENLTSEIIENYSKGVYNTNGKFDVTKLEEDTYELLMSAAMKTLVDLGMGDKAEELFKKFTTSNKLLAKEYQKLERILANPRVAAQQVKKATQKVDNAAKKVVKDVKKATAAKAKKEAAKKTLDEGQKQLRKENEKTPS